MTRTHITSQNENVTHQIERKEINMASRTYKGLITATATAALGVALFVGSSFIGGSSASAAPAAIPALPPGCINILTCQPPVSDPPPPTPTPCTKIVCQVVGDLDDLPVFEPADPTPTPCIKIVCQVVGDLDDLPVFDAGTVDPAPTATPEPPTPEPTPTTPDPTPTTPADPTPTTPPAPPADNGGGNPPAGGQQTGGGQPTTGGSQNPAQGGEQPAGTINEPSPVEDDEDEPVAAGETDDTEKPAETEGSASVQTSDDESGFSLLTVALAAVGLAAPASLVAFFLARRQKVALLD